MLSVPWAHLRLPPFPQVAIRVLHLVNSETAQLHRLSELISSDPAFSSEILTIANSALYAPRFPTTSILQAISVLGANNLQGICLTVGTRAYLGKRFNQPSMRSAWRHSLACALIAGQLASAGCLDKDIAYTAGMIHDVGRLALAVIRPREYGLLMESHGGAPTSILDAESQMFGCNHCEAGRQMIADWKMPAEFEAIVFTHHAPMKKDGPWGMVELINVSCKMADAAGFPAFKGCTITPFQDLLDLLPARERGRFHATAEALALDLTSKIEAVERA